MRRTDRLFDIIQFLRTSKRPLTAAELAARLEVSERTIYRDIAALQASRLPIDGVAGIGYVLRRGFDLPPLMFSLDEIEAIALGSRMLSRTGDQGLQKAAERVLSKITTALPEALRPHLTAPPFFVSGHGAPPPEVADLSLIRHAIRAERKMRIGYSDANGTVTERIIWPFGLAYYVEATLVAAWCELRSDFRHFRVDRIRHTEPMDAEFPVSARVLFAQWIDRFGLGNGQT